MHVGPTCFAFFMGDMNKLELTRIVEASCRITSALNSSACKTSQLIGDLKRREKKMLHS